MAVSSSGLSGKQRIKGFVEKRLLLGQPLTLELSAILIVYFVQGILGLARLAVSFFLKYDNALSPADSLVVDRAREEVQGSAGTLQSLALGASAIGGLLTAYLGGLLLERTSTQVIFAITATFPLIVCGVAWLIAEDPVTEKSNLKVVVDQV